MFGTNKTPAKKADGLETNKETKNKFDVLLKEAFLHTDTLNNKMTSNINKSDQIKSQMESDSKIMKQIFNKDEDIISSRSSLQTTLHSIENIAANLTNENYILEKFFTDSTTIKQDDKNLNFPQPDNNTLEFLKKPLPKPRTIESNSQQTSSIISKEIYNIKSPNTSASQLLQEFESFSADSSTGTYTVANKVPEKDLENTISSSGTYTVYNNKINIPVGDIVIHTSEQANNVVQIVKQSKKEKSNKTPHSTDKAITNEPDSNYIVHKVSKKKNINKKLRKIPRTEDETIDDIQLQELNKRHIGTKHKTIKPIILSDDEFEAAKVSDFIKQTIFEDLIGIVIYKTDKLLLDSLINHPCVKIHLVDLKTGDYLKQSTDDTQYIYPLITKAYSLQEKRSLIPYWEELLVFGEDYNYLINYENKVIIFFEILDFISFNNASIKYKTEGSNSGWHKVAWAFLKPVSSNGQLNTDQKLRLQLYKPKKLQLHKSNKECFLYDWWSSGTLKKYPSTIHISVRKIKNSEGPVNSYTSLLREANSIKEIYDETQVDDDNLELVDKNDKSDNIKNAFRKIGKWSKTKLQSCKIPNKIHANLTTSTKGCLMIKFSNNGLLIACSVVTLNRFPIFIYGVQHNNPLYCKFSGHEALIYDLHWSSDDKYLITASADCTVQVWNVYNETYHPKQVLPHPSFVYSTLLKFYSKCHLFTGSYDHILRVWQAKNEIDSNYELFQELEGHEGYITSLCSSNDDNLFYSADSIGTIIEWMLSNEEWVIKRNLQLKELHYTIINNIILHPKSNRLAVFCSDSIIRLVDLPVGCIIQWYKGATNFRSYMRGCISPCGNLIFAPSDDGCVYIWNTDTGILQASYIPFPMKDKQRIIPYCLNYHPFDHILAISQYSESYPVLLCTFDPMCTGAELRLKDLTNTVDPIRKYSSVLKKNVTATSDNNDNKKGKEGTSISSILNKMEQVIVKAKSEK